MNSITIGTEIAEFTAGHAARKFLAARLPKRTKVCGAMKLNRPEDSLLSEVIHELRTPLASIVGFAEIILSEPGLETAKRQEFTSIIRQEGERLSELIDYLAGHSFINGQSGMTRVEEQNIVSLMTTVLDALQNRMSAKSLTVKTEFAERALFVRCDREALVRVFSLLLLNAVNTARENGTVTAGAQLVGSMVHAWISDDGPGIPAKDIPEIFQDSARDESTETGTAKLPFSFTHVKKILELHGGAISVQSKELRGTTFTIILPIVG